jgi:flagellar protein FliO/FliZ
MFQYIINLGIFIPVVIFLIIICIRFGKINSDKLDRFKYIKILERTTLSKDTNIFVIKIGDEGCVISSSPSKLEILKDLSKEDIESIEKSKLDFSNQIKDIEINKILKENKFISNFINKFIKERIFENKFFKKKNLPEEKDEESFEQIKLKEE